MTLEFIIWNYYNVHVKNDEPSFPCIFTEEVFSRNLYAFELDSVTIKFKTITLQFLIKTYLKLTCIYSPNPDCTDFCCSGLWPA